MIIHDLAGFAKQDTDETNHKGRTQTMEGARMVQENSTKIDVNLANNLAGKGTGNPVSNAASKAANRSAGNSANGMTSSAANEAASTSTTTPFLQSSINSPAMFVVPSFVTTSNDKANRSKIEPASTLDQTLSQTLGQKIAQIENRKALLEDEASEIRVPLGIAEIDAALDPYFQKSALNRHNELNNPDVTANDIHRDIPRGIIANALHEIRVETNLGAASGAGFALALGLTIARSIAKIAANQTPSPLPLLPVFWISDPFTRMEYGDFYGPGLSVFGQAPQSLIRIHAKDSSQALWAAGEIVATKGAAGCCLLEVRGNRNEIDLTTSRRLMLRARASRTPVIILRQSGKQEASAAATRWCVAPASSTQATSHRRNNLPFLGNPAFTVSLEKCRAGRTGQWTLEWNPHEHCLTLAKPRTPTIISANNLHQSALSGCPPAKAFNRPDRPPVLGQCMAAERAS